MKPSYYHEIIKSLLYFIAAMGGYDIDPREWHHLNTEFSTMLDTVATSLENCTSVDILKFFLQYSHPLYPVKQYIESHVYHNAKTARDILFNLFPQYINYKDHFLLQEIVNRFGDEECRHHYQKYELMFQRSVHKLMPSKEGT